MSERAALRALTIAAVLNLGVNTCLPAAQAAETVVYTYDANGRLVQSASSGSVNIGQKNTICYDAADNRIVYKSDSTGAGITCPTPTAAPVTMPLPSISVSSPEAIEGQTLYFVISLSNPYTTNVSVSYATATGTAAANDFTATSGTVTFTPGQMTRVVSVATTSDARVEFDEYMKLDLNNPAGGATIAVNPGVGAIIDNNGGGVN